MSWGQRRRLGMEQFPSSLDWRGEYRSFGFTNHPPRSVQSVVKALPPSLPDEVLCDIAAMGTMKHVPCAALIMQTIHRTNVMIPSRLSSTGPDPNPAIVPYPQGRWPLPKKKPNPKIIASTTRIMFNPPNVATDCAAWKRTQGRLSIRKKMMPVSQPRT